MSVYLVFVLIFLIGLSGFFSSSETALIASGRVKLSHLAAQGDAGAKRALRLRENPGKLLGTILVGNNLVNVMAASIATILIGPLYATLVVTLLLLVFAEITPKTLAAFSPEPFAARVARVVKIFGYLFKPVVWMINAICDFMLFPFFRVRKKQGQGFSRGELLTAIRLGARDGELEPSEARMTQEILALKYTRVKDIMITLDEVDAFSESATFSKVIEEFACSGNTRYPVYRGEVKEMIGVLLAKDLLVHRAGAEENWRQYVRPLLKVRAELEADELLRDMQIQRSHMAAVEDKEGEVIGIVTMEDVLEEIFGEIQDEYDDEEGELIRELGSGRFLVRSEVEVDNMCKVINIDLGPIDQYITIGEWFANQVITPTKNQRVKQGNVRVVQRGSNIYEILVKGHMKASIKGNNNEK